MSACMRVRACVRVCARERDLFQLFFVLLVAAGDSRAGGGSIYVLSRHHQKDLQRMRAATRRARIFAYCFFFVCVRTIVCVCVCAGFCVQTGCARRHVNACWRGAMFRVKTCAPLWSTTLMVCTRSVISRSVGNCFAIFRT